jgi:hypothetical protein
MPSLTFLHGSAVEIYRAAERNKRPAKRATRTAFAQIREE